MRVTLESPRVTAGSLGTRRTREVRIDGILVGYSGRSGRGQLSLLSLRGCTDLYELFPTQAALVAWVESNPERLRAA